MWKTASWAINQALCKDSSLLAKNTCLHEQIRTTYILKRKFQPLLHKKGSNPKPLRSRHYVYELIKDTSVEKQPNIDVILMTHVEGIGNAGDKLSVKPQFGYNNLLLPGLAVYASSENIEKYSRGKSESELEQQFSSSTAVLTVKTLSRVTLSVVMNKEHPWKLQAWHVKTCFRKCGYVVPESAITLPEKPIEGPDMNLEGKEFFVTVTINSTEKVNVRCRLHHWSTNIVDRIPYVQRFWEEPSEPLYPEFSDILDKIPRKNTNVDTKQLKM